MSQMPSPAAQASAPHDTWSASPSAAPPNAAIEVKNSQTGAVYQTVTTDTGNFNVTQVPTGTYDLTTKAAGFKTYVRQNIVIPVAQTVRLDIPLEVGEANALDKVHGGVGDISVAVQGQPRRRSAQPVCKSEPTGLGRRGA